MPLIVAKMTCIIPSVLQENGLVYVSNGTMEDGDASSSETKTTNRVPAKETGLAALITPEAAEILGLAEGSLGGWNTSQVFLSFL